jgi:hypothetical protein
VCPHLTPKKSVVVQLEETIIARQRLSKHIPAATNKYATTEELFEAVFSMRFVWYQIACVESKAINYSATRTSPVSCFKRVVAATRLLLDVH